MPRDQSSEMEIFAAMTRFLHAATQEASVELESFGLTAAQFQVLMQIRSRPGLSQRELAEAFSVTKGNVSQLIKKLELAGLVTRVRNQSTDELVLSDAGRLLLKRVVPAQRAFMVCTFSGLSAPERELLSTLIGRLSNS